MKVSAVPAGTGYALGQTRQQAGEFTDKTQPALQAEDAAGRAARGGDGGPEDPAPEEPGRGSRMARRPAAIGFVPRSEALHRAYNFLLAGLLLVLALPMIGMISLLLLLTQARPVFYRGARVGRGGRPFDILKFRTLDTEKAASLTRDQVLPDGSGLETPLGGFLRETRLDELPQLWNILRGDMNLTGPRPVRPEIARLLSGGNYGSGARFRVKPGLLGPTQALMSHGTPKAVRARLNAATCSKPVNYWCEVRVAGLVAACVLARAASRAAAKLPGRAPDSGADLAARAGVAVVCRDRDGQQSAVLRIGEDCFVPAGGFAPGPGELVIRLPDNTSRTARILCERGVSPAGGEEEVLLYRPASDYAHYLLERYLHQRVVIPHHSHFLFSRLLRACRAAPGSAGALDGGARRGEGSQPARVPSR